MNTLIDKPKALEHRDGIIHLTLESGRELSFPISENRLLRNGTDSELNNVEFSPFGIHWIELDEDLSVAGILEGNWGQG